MGLSAQRGVKKGVKDKPEDEFEIERERKIGNSIWIRDMAR